MTEPFTAPAVVAEDRRIVVDRVLPSRSDPVGIPASGAIGGPVGRHAAIGRSRHWTPLRVVFLLALVTLAIGWFGKAACLQEQPDGDGGRQLNWNNQRQYYSLCYSDVIALYGAEYLTPADLAAGAFPYRTYWYDAHPDGTQTKRYMEYPVVTGMFMYAAAQATVGWNWLADRVPLIPKPLDAVTFFNISALFLSLFWLLAIWATMMTDRRRMWIGALMAISPLVIVHAFTNFDTIAIAMLALAMLSWSRGRPWLTGVFIGLGIAVKLYPALLLVAIVLVAIGNRRMREFAAVVVGTLVTWLVVNLPILIAFPAGWREFLRLNRDRGYDIDSAYMLIHQVTGWNPGTGVINGITAALLVLVVVLVSWLALAAPQQPALAQLMFLLVAGFLLVNKVWSPQYSLWLVPLAVLAIPRTRLLLAWMVIDALVWVPRMGLFLDARAHWLPPEWFYVAIFLRGAMVLALCGVVVYDVLRPRVSAPASWPAAPPRARMRRVSA